MAFRLFRFGSDEEPSSSSLRSAKESQSGTGQTQQLMEELYKRNAELAIRNKTLTLLRRLDEVSLKTLGAEEMAKEMCLAISEELGYDLVALSIVNPSTHEFKWLAIASSTPWIADAIKTINIQREKVSIAENREFIEGASTDAGQLVSDPKDVYSERLVNAIAEVATFYKIEPTKNSLVHKLNFGNQPLGIFILSSSRSLKDTSTYEHESIIGIVGLISLALYKAEIYKQLQDLTHNLQQKVDEQTKEVKVAYEVEKKARVELEELDKTKDQFILTTQHHLRTPLTIIKGYLTVLKDDHSISKESLSNLEKIASSTETLSQFINELLQITELKVRRENNREK